MDVITTLFIVIAILSMSKYPCERCDIHIKRNKERDMEKERERGGGKYSSEHLCTIQENFYDISYFKYNKLYKCNRVSLHSP